MKWLECLVILECRAACTCNKVCARARCWGVAGDVFYVIQEGNFTIYNDQGQELARVGKGSCFGELALLRKV